jgi:nucleotide-binding universal stress UspA family protein
MGDLMVVQDFIEAIEDFMEEENIRPDLVVIPSSPFNLSGWGRDLTGRVYLDIERRSGCPVALVECDPIFD